MGRTFEVRLGDQTCTVEQLRTRQASGWRKATWELLEGILKPLLTLIDWRSVDTNDAGAVQALIDSLGPAVLDSIDLVTDTLVAYAPGLKDAIEGAYDDEIMGAFVEVLKRALPFGELVRALSGAVAPSASGSPQTPTSPSSPSASGDAGTTS
jgi:hypothetical protein